MAFNEHRLSPSRKAPRVTACVVRHGGRRLGDESCLGSPSFAVSCSASSPPLEPRWAHRAVCTTSSPFHEPSAVLELLNVPDSSSSPDSPDAEAGTLGRPRRALLWCLFTVRPSPPARSSSAAPATRSPLHQGLTDASPSPHLSHTPSGRLTSPSSGVPTDVTARRTQTRRRRKREGRCPRYHTGLGVVRDRKSVV